MNNYLKSLAVPVALVLTAASSLYAQDPSALLKYASSIKNPHIVYEQGNTQNDTLQIICDEDGTERGTVNSNLTRVALGKGTDSLIGRSPAGYTLSAGTDASLWYFSFSNPDKSRDSSNVDPKKNKKKLSVLEKLIKGLFSGN